MSYTPTVWKSGDVVSSLKLNKLENGLAAVADSIGEYYYSITNNNDWHHVDAAGAYSAGDVVYLKTFAYENCTVNIVLWFTNSTSSTIYANEPTGKEYWITLPANVSYVRVSYKTSSVVSGTFSAVVINSAAEDAFGYIAAVQKMVENNKSDADAKFTTIDSPFSVAVDSKLKGIIAFNMIGNANIGDVNFDVMDYEEFRVTRFFYKSSFYMYFALQGYKNGAWINYDFVTIPLADAPTEKAVMILTSDYKRFQVAYIPSLMTAGYVDGVDYRIKHEAVNPFFVALRKQTEQTIKDLAIGDFELQDHTANIVTVKKDGSGDYTTIAAAYAAITNSSFLNQYEIVVYPGTYEEVNLICPKYTHTHGLFPGSVIVTSVGKTGTNPVFDQKNAPSKLSNMTIISGTGYCVHQDASLDGVVLVNENLHCRKDYGESVANFGWQNKVNPAVVGDGAQYYGAKFIWKSCTFEDGEVAFHSNSSSDDHANQHFILENCKLVNAWVWLGMAGSAGASRNSHCVAEFKNLYAPVGCPAIKAKYGERADDETNWIWQVIGGDNKNLSIIFDNYVDPLAGEMWQNINTTEKAFVQIAATVEKGQWLTDAFAVCSANENSNNVFGIALEDGSAGDSIGVWVGNAYRDASLSPGEYGIGSDGKLSASATTKIGKVLNNIFYRY